MLFFELLNGQLVVADSVPTITSPIEPNWTTITTGSISTTTELQDLIDSAGTTPTKIELLNNISRNDNSGESGHHVLTIAGNQEIYLTSADNSKITIDVTFSEDATRGVAYVDEGGTLFLENIILTGGNRMTAEGGGGGVLLGLGLGGSTLVMKDGAEITGNSAGFGAGVYVHSGSQLYMLGGQIDNNTSTIRGGGVYAYQGGEFYMENGEISNNIGGSQGGDGVYIDGSSNLNSLFTMTNGVITHNGSASSPGGGVILNNATFNLAGGEISYHYGIGGGGGVAVTDSIFNMWGGTIKNNTNYYGGAVTVIGSMGETSFDSAVCSTFNMYGGTIGGDSESDANTGSYPGVMIGNAGWNKQGGTFNMYGGKISHNVSSGDFKHGGGVFVTNYGVANISGNSEISYNRLTSNGIGGGIGVYFGKLTISENAILTNNIAGSGGGIYAGYSDVNITNATIKNNTSLENGGGLFLNSSNDYSIQNVIISGNTAQNDGGGIYLTSSASLHLNGGEISDNIASNDGGGIFDVKYPDFSNLFLPKDAELTFSNNKASKKTVATTLPTIGDWSGKVLKTSIDGEQFTGVIKDKINDYLANGGDLNKLIVFNNYDINMLSEDYFYTVLFESNGGSQVSSQLVTDNGTGLVEEPNEPTKDGNKFLGWFKDEDLTEVYDFSTFVSSDITLYAKWEESPSEIEKYTISYELNGGINAESNPLTYLYGVGVPSFADPTKEGFKFTGWTDEIGDVITNISDSEKGDKILYAKWEKNLVSGKEETTTGNKKTNSLPKTGEVHNNGIAIVGLVIVFSFGGYIAFKLKKA